MAAALILTVGYVASGMTNILFEHDLMDSAFITILSLIAASSSLRNSKVGSQSAIQDYR